MHLTKCPTRSYRKKSRTTTFHRTLLGEPVGTGKTGLCNVAFGIHRVHPPAASVKTVFCILLLLHHHLLPPVQRFVIICNWNSHLEWALYP